MRRLPSRETTPEDEKDLKTTQAGRSRTHGTCASKAVKPRRRRRQTQSKTIQSQILQESPQVTLLPSIYLGPLAPEKCAALELCHILQQLNLRNAILTSLPRHVGGLDSRVDAAADAVVSAYQHRFRPCPTSEAAYLRLSCKAVSTLRANLGTDDLSLTAVGLLSLANILADGDPWKTQTAHMRGMYAILASRPSNYKLNEFTRAVVLTCAAMEFASYCTSGEASPWDDERWLSQDIRHSLDGTRPEFAKLRDVNFQLLVKLPALIRLVRVLREHSSDRRTEDEGMSAFKFARQLLQFEDRQAENEILHRIRVVPTKDSAKAAIMKYTYEMDSHEDMETAVHHWALRLILLRLCVGLNDLRHNSFDPTWLLADQERLAVNIIMAIPADSRGHLSPRGQALALVTLWGTLSDRKTLRGTPVGVIARWVWRKLEVILPVPAESVNPTSLNATAEMFAGGPLTGLFVDIQQGRPPCFAFPSRKGFGVGSLRQKMHLASTLGELVNEHPGSDRADVNP
ncbi:hypothetical protein LTR15_004526 [Elasticomyces elasticus]|nr:hypothetical protein LTR15_004526 [Elasticomyces elasticus]